MQKIEIQAFVTVRGPDGKVKAQGSSKPNNLILDNFGTWLAAFIQAITEATRTITLTDDGGTSRTVYIYGETAYLFNYPDGAVDIGTQLRVGSGSTAPARDDYAIETAFATSPESTYFDTGTGSYAAGAISLSGSITAGGSGTIREVGLFGYWTAVAAGTRYRFMLFHDALSPAVSFSAGDIIGVSYSITL